jgi:signal transduction histidine kinase
MNHPANENMFMLQLFIAATLLIVLFAIFLVFVLVTHRNKQNTIYMEKQEMHREHQRELLEEQERVLDTVSVQVHDQIGQAVHMMGMHLQWLLKRATDEAQKDKINEMINLCKKLIMETKHISYLLNSDYVKVHGLEQLIEQELERLEKHHQITGKFIGNHKDCALDAEARLIIFRIAQEAFQNIIRHSGARHVTVMMEESADTFRLQIVDDGMGFSQERLDPMPGLGLNNMRNRAKLLKGELDIGSMPTKGTTVTLTVHNSGSSKL